jgi:hypothetical protein
LTPQPTVHKFFTAEEVQHYIDGIQKKNRELSSKNDELSTLAENMANAERDYNVALSRKLLTLKADGMSITLCDKIAKGDKIIADLYFQYRVAEAIYDAGKKKIQSLAINIDSYRSLLSWAKSERERV